MTLPAGTTTAENQEVKTATIDLDRAIATSAAEISDSQTAKKSKRGRGRPPTHGRYSQKPSGEDAPPVAPAAAGADPIAPAGPTVEMKPVFRQLMKMPFDIAAAKYHCPELALTDDEVNDPTELAQAMMDAYAPQLMASDPKRVLAFAFAFSVGMLALKKAGVYRAHQATLTAKASTAAPAVNAPAAAPPAPAIPFPAVNAGQQMRPPAMPYQEVGVPAAPVDIFRRADAVSGAFPNVPAY